MDWLSALVSGIGSAAQLVGGIYTNKQNIRAQKEANATNQAIAERNNQLAIDLANTAHQREVQDLVAAGLNPILSVGGSGAQSPVLKSATVEAPNIENPTSGIAGGVKQVAQYLSKGYAEQVKAQEIANNNAQLQKDTLETQIAADRQQAQYDYLLSKEQTEALYDYFGYDPVYDDRGNVVGHTSNSFNADKYENARQLIMDGIKSDMKNRANANWRANLGVISGAVGSTAGAAANSARAARMLIR